MFPFIPFIHMPEPKKQNEPLPLYVELYPPMERPQEDEEEKEEESHVIVIELL